MYNTLGHNLLSISKTISFPNVLERYSHHCCKVLVVGGGTGGCSMAAKFARKFDKAPNHVIIIEPQDEHYYQPLFTLIGGGIKQLHQSKRPMKDVLPKKAQWLKDKVVSFQPKDNTVTTCNGDIVQYEIMIVAMGLSLYWDKIPGLVEGLKNPEANVCSIYGPDTVSNVFGQIKKTKDGNAIFTFPNSPVKCPGAPQKIAYLSEDYWCKKNTRSNINVTYNTNLPVIFGVEKYADALWKVCGKRNINVNTCTNLIEIKPDKKEAIFQNSKDPKKICTQEYSLLHVTPPMGPPMILKENKSLTNDAGFLDVDQYTLRHSKFNNIYGLGDCTNTPNSKTMAAIACQSKVLYQNILDHLDGKKMSSAYNGYASCPLVTSDGKCILAEFDYNLKPYETFPVDQSKESYFMYLLKKHFFPFLYWNFMLKGHWSGPELMKRIFKPFKNGC